jgi:hypothetical protein
MKKPCVVTFTSRSTKEMLADSGSKAWRLDAKRARKCDYLVCAWNAYGPIPRRAHSDRRHREGFLIAPITSIEPVTPLRRIIRFRQYAEISVAELWSRNQNPVWYSALDDLGIELDGLTFKDIPTS